MELWGLHYKKDLNLLEWGRKNDNRTGEERLKEPWFCERALRKEISGETFQYLIVFIKKL